MSQPNSVNSKNFSWRIVKCDGSFRQAKFQGDFGHVTNSSSALLDHLKVEQFQLFRDFSLVLEGFFTRMSISRFGRLNSRGKVYSSMSKKRMRERSVGHAILRVLRPREM